MVHYACTDHTTSLASKAFHDKLGKEMSQKYGLVVLRPPNGYYSNRIHFMMHMISLHVRKPVYMALEVVSCMKHVPIDKVGFSRYCTVDKMCCDVIASLPFWLLFLERFVTDKRLKHVLELLNLPEIFICVSTSATMFTKVYTKSMKIANLIVNSSLHRQYLKNLMDTMKEKVQERYDRKLLFSLNIFTNIKITSMLHYNQITPDDRNEVGTPIAIDRCRISLPMPTSMKAVMENHDKRRTDVTGKRMNLEEFHFLIQNPDIQYLTASFTRFDPLYATENDSILSEQDKKTIDALDYFNIEDLDIDYDDEIDLSTLQQYHYLFLQKQISRYKKLREERRRKKL
jgi:hypothetical protein